MIVLSENLPEIWSKDILVEKETGEYKGLFIFVDKIPKAMNLQVCLAARRSRAEITIAYLGRATDNTEIKITLIHDASETYGRIVVKAALFDDARFVLKGMLEITPRAKGADAYLLAKGLMVSPQARAEIYPYLEIHTDEVKASHGTSVGRIDERQLFYLQSRGIEKADAEAIMLSAYFRDVAQGMPAEYQDKFFQKTGY